MEFFELQEDQKPVASEFIKEDVTYAVNKLFEKNICKVNDVECDSQYPLYRKRTMASYILLSLGAIILLFYQNNIKDTDPELFEAIAVYIGGYGFLLSGFAGVVYYSYKSYVASKECLKNHHEIIKLSDSDIINLLRIDKVVTSSFIVKENKKHFAFECYFYFKKDFLAFCDGSYVFEIPLNRITIKKDNEPIIFKDDLGEYKHSSIKKKMFSYKSNNNYKIVIDGKEELVLKMTEYHFSKIVDLLVNDYDIK